jgi:hypothetical protein
MKIIPVLQDIKSATGEHTMPVWEIQDFPLPDIEIHKCEEIGIFEQRRKGADKEKENKRIELAVSLTEQQKKEWEDNMAYFMHYMQTVGYNDYSFYSVWMEKLNNFFINSSAENFTILKDLPGSAMGSHLDNRAMFGAFIINLIDNPAGASTVFSRTFNGEMLYQAPTKKGDGVFFINTHEMWHKIENFSSDDRYVIIRMVGVV